jgi:anti-sigma B factor antagonist
VSEPDEQLFQTSQERRRGKVIVHASGELDAVTVDQLSEGLDAAQNGTKKRSPVVLDLSEITYLSSAGVAALVIHTRRCAEHGGTLRIVAAQPAVLRPITLTGADDALDIVPTLEQAVRA